MEQTNILRRLVRNERATVAGAALVTMTLIGLSRITGIVRDIGRTTLFGRDWHTDAYVSAFSIPDLIYFLASGGALSAGFVPVFTGYLTKGEDERAIRTFRVLMTYLGLLLLSLIIAFEVLAPQLVALLFPGMVGDEQKFTLTVLLVRILLPAQFFFVLGSLFTGALWSLRYFAEPQVQSVLYNLFILLGGILGAQFCAHWLGRGIEGMAIGALTGAAVGAGLVQARKLWQVGMDFRPCFDWRDEGARQVLKLVIPVVFSLSVTQINAIILPRSFSSLLPHGAATAVEMANRIMQLPVALFGASVGIALFPTLSALATKEAIDDLRRQVTSGLRTVLFMTVPTAVLMAVLREPIVALFFEYGRWKSSDTQATALALLFYSLGVPAMSCQQVLARGFYALRDTWTPVWVGLLSFALAFSLNAALVHSPLQQGGLALAFSISAWFNITLLTILLRKRLNGLEGAAFLKLIVWLLPSSAVMGLVATFVLSFLPIGGVFERLLRVGLPTLIGGTAFLAFMLRSNLPEVQQVISKLQSLKSRWQKGR
ncbi:murein biosynthesis integral membrane protein MurJ [Fervidibacter sacchari]|uniref:Probable lipid II flippase MurJ n=1 Tax=Candidatus Fervidibacter sacchari TaxID=1448929 RepID=A0ABT2ESD4_9BACT|nr:murein biosynthesis integral membrane protein MurJ [Candidatus Fervidibacter sacchari]MCS3919810.1 putative peptidoglycan lipid II flippase [Candidatus Fervidibacter sacchari]WKU16949.1 murein biosynthesis integral membrane protein MurJ [Candidatus Fervidibacter sacchari]